MKFNHKPFSFLITIMVLASLACDHLTGTPAAQPTPMPAAPTTAPAQTTDPNARVLVQSAGTPTMTEYAKPVPIGSNEIEVPSDTVIVLPITQEMEQAVTDVEASINDLKNNGWSDDQILQDAIIAGSLLDLFLNAMDSSLCRELGGTMGDKLLSDSGGIDRIQRLNGWTGTTEFLKAIKSMRVDVISLKAIIASGYTQGKFVFLLTVKGKEYGIIFSRAVNEPTILPFAKLAEGTMREWLTNPKAINQLIKVNGGGQITRGQVFSGQEVRNILGAGTFNLTGDLMSRALISLAKFGQCLEEKLKASPRYKAWVDAGQPNDTGAHNFSWGSLDEVKKDAQLLSDLGILHTLIPNDTAQEVLPKLVIAGAGTVVIILAPVTIPGGVIGGVSVQTTRYVLAAALVP